MSKRRQKWSGFTLIEMVLVLIILGIVSAAAARPLGQMISTWFDTREAYGDEADMVFALSRIAREVRQHGISCDNGDSVTDNGDSVKLGEDKNITINDGALRLDDDPIFWPESGSPVFECISSEADPSRLFRIRISIDRTDSEDREVTTYVYSR
ncbi:hypothetical protein HH1059_06600 [Halorhodospira halochloris]|uniref:MSHA pilin protein MshD n=1 Tax=Halorhodospira halochloris TaxID=1052 RepID=A0A0X8X946_HALHR|nr:type II secretion system protein [Halorhodospira halochloris]MBK1652868.1 hypothetical protein [Halorhodospira halochloris]BAU57347.1 hypothetical protein HH1059_06600 [Halorhodospira halochloris]